MYLINSWLFKCFSILRFKKKQMWRFFHASPLFLFILLYHTFINNLWLSTERDLLLMLITFFTCLFLPLEYGVLVGIVANVGSILCSAAKPKISIQVQKVGSIVEVEIKNIHRSFPCKWFRIVNLCFLSFRTTTG